MRDRREISPLSAKAHQIQEDLPEPLVVSALSKNNVKRRQSSAASVKRRRTACFIINRPRTLEQPIMCVVKIVMACSHPPRSRARPVYSFGPGAARTTSAHGGYIDCRTMALEAWRLSAPGFRSRAIPIVAASTRELRGALVPRAPRKPEAALFPKEVNAGVYYYRETATIIRR
jgi:hypothetical protein